MIPFLHRYQLTTWWIVYVAYCIGVFRVYEILR